MRGHFVGTPEFISIIFASQVLYTTLLPIEPKFFTGRSLFLYILASIWVLQEDDTKTRLSMQEIYWRRVREKARRTFRLPSVWHLWYGVEERGMEQEESRP